MLSSKSYEEFSLQNTFKAGNKHKKNYFVDFYTTILLERFMPGKIYTRYRCEHSTFKVFCMTMPKLRQMHVL
jgi:hypothetical protein